MPYSTPCCPSPTPQGDNPPLNAPLVPMMLQVQRVPVPLSFTTNLRGLCPSSLPTVQKGMCLVLPSKLILFLIPSLQSLPLTHTQAKTANILGSLPCVWQCALYKSSYRQRTKSRNSKLVQGLWTSALELTCVGDTMGLSSPSSEFCLSSSLQCFWQLLENACNNLLSY